MSSGQGMESTRMVTNSRLPVKGLPAHVPSLCVLLVLLGLVPELRL